MRTSHLVCYDISDDKRVPEAEIWLDSVSQVVSSGAVMENCWEALEVGIY